MKLLLATVLTLLATSAFAGEGNGDPFPVNNRGQVVKAGCAADVGQESAPNCPQNVIVLRPSNGGSCPAGQQLVYDLGYKRWMCVIESVQGSGG